MRKLFALLGIATVASLMAYNWLRDDAIWHAEKNFHLTTLVGDQNGYILLPPEFVAQPFIRRIVWSPDGRYALLVQTVVRIDAPQNPQNYDMRHRVLAWSRATKRLTVLWESERTQTDINPERDFQFAFYKGIPACLLAVRVPSEGLPSWSVYHATLGGNTKMLGQFEDAYFLSPPEDTVRYLVFYLRENEKTNYLYAPVSTAGQLGEPRLLPPSLIEFGIYSMLSSEFPEYQLWYHDGKRLVGTHMEFKPDESGRLVGEPKSFFLWDPRTNTEQAIPQAEVRYYASQPRTLLRTDTVSQRVVHGADARTTSTTWLTEGEGATLIAADSEIAQVSPQGDALLYIAHGAAFYRALTRMDTKEAQALQERTAVEPYLKNGKQIGLALMMYVQDYDECFPPNWGNTEVAHVILPYVKSNEVFEVDGVFAFHYLMDGQTLSQIQSPGETVVGYLQLPNGRVVIHADGHVKWKRD
ncbi:MAG: hypothetical protein KatS3mg016_0650 [Fimbriimonadales bacterium]|nr:MAG: hypothetical protein KatS3mg016_0650 [Fimbriimonadales bacterium]